MKLFKNLKKHKSSSMILVGYKSADKRGAMIMRSLGKIDPEMRFFGIGGTEMIKDEKFENSISLNNYMDKPFQQEKNFKADPRFYFMLCSLPLNINNAILLSELRKTKFYQNFENNKIDDVNFLITVGNQLLSTRILEQITKIYYTKKRVLPLRVHFDRTKRLFDFRFHSHLDLFVNTMPSKAFDRQEYNFPGVFMGKQVVFDAWKFLLLNSQKYKGLVKENIIYLQREINHLVMEELIFKQRESFREEMKIDESATVLFISPGDHDTEFKTNMPVVTKAIEHLVERFTSTGRLSKKAFHIIVSFERELSNSKYEEDFKKMGIPFNFIYGNEKGIRYRAMAASDFGACQEGDSVLECASFQLPVVVLNKKTFFQSYVTLLYNTFNSEINLLKDGDIYPETLGRFFPEKISEFWEEWYTQPKTRFRIAIETNNRLFQFLPQSDQDSQRNLTIDSSVFSPFLEPEFVLEKFLTEKYSEIQAVKKIANTTEVETERKKIMGLNF